MSGFLSVIRDLSAFCTLHFACKQVTFCVQSYKLGAFAKVVTYQKQHSVAGIKDDNSGMIATFNRYSNYTEAQHNDGNTTYFNSIDEIANKEGCIFDVGYLIQKK